jgi:hypothetical protein
MSQRQIKVDIHEIPILKDVMSKDEVNPFMIKCHVVTCELEDLFYKIVIVKMYDNPFNKKYRTKQMIPPILALDTFVIEICNKGVHGSVQPTLIRFVRPVIYQ